MLPAICTLGLRSRHSPGMSRFGDARKDGGQKVRISHRRSISTWRCVSFLKIIGMAGCYWRIRLSLAFCCLPFPFIILLRGSADTVGVVFGSRPSRTSCTARHILYPCIYARSLYGVRRGKALHRRQARRLLLLVNASASCNPCIFSMVARR